ncbi:hypothetical protein, partial [Teichococcus deserti]|uniref:hypothetical protein n=1 Tax=Teichococcus deserti TaxID=1817963 RepID=UPI001A95D01D
MANAPNPAMMPLHQKRIGETASCRVTPRRPSSLDMPRRVGAVAEPVEPPVPLPSAPLQETIMSHETLVARR